jgi:V8-like Glu-specific endopeptidase
MPSFHASVARLHAAAGAEHGKSTKDVLGGGFLVAPQLVVTCAHVLSNVHPDERIEVCFPQASGNPTSWATRLTSEQAAREDVAFLLLDTEPSGVLGLGLRSAPGERGTPVDTFGFARGTFTSGSPGTAEMGNRFKDTDPHTSPGGPRWLLALGSANDVAEGFSGAPLVDRDGLVVGMVTALPQRGHRGVDLAYATPASDLRKSPQRAS